VILEINTVSFRELIIEYHLVVLFAWFMLVLMSKEGDVFGSHLRCGEEYSRVVKI
jgi:hypothetical protein